MTRSQDVLEVHDLRVEIPTRRGIVRAVDGVSFTVGRGEAVGLVGESGCGKTMTLRAVLGLLPPRARISGGQVLFEGRDLGRMSSAFDAGSIPRAGRSVSDSHLHLYANAAHSRSPAVSARRGSIAATARENVATSVRLAPVATYFAVPSRSTHRPSKYP